MSGATSETTDLRAALRDIGYGVIGGLQDPHPLLASIRETTPVLKIKDAWLVTDYEDVDSIVRNARDWLVSHEAYGTVETIPYIIDPKKGIWSRVYNTILITNDAPQHRRLRQIVAPLFTPRGTEQFREQVKETIESQLQEAMASPAREMDLRDDFSFPMPTRVILDILGLPQEEAHRFYEITDLIVPPAQREETPAEWFAMADEVCDRHLGYVTEEAEARHSDPGEDLLTRIATAEENGERLSDVELAGMVFFLIAAGYETTASTMTTGVYLLLRHPEQFARLREDRSLIPSAVEEILRFEGPVRNAGPRFAAEDTELRGHKIRKGEMVWASLTAANRDPMKFPDADTFDITRSENDHLAFSAGPHFCLGRPLARMEIEIGLEAMMDGLPESLELAGPAIWEESFVVRKLKSLPLRW